MSDDEKRELTDGGADFAPGSSSAPARHRGGKVDPANPPYDVDREIVVIGQCDCGWNWKRYVDGPALCPRCFPNQPKPFAERLRDPDEFLGPGWYWENSRGWNGSWRPLSEVVPISRREFDAVVLALEPFRDDFDNAATLLPQLAEKYVQIRRVLVALADRERERDPHAEALVDSRSREPYLRLVEDAPAPKGEDIG